MYDCSRNEFNQILCVSIDYFIHVHFVRSLHELQTTMQPHTDGMVRHLIHKSIDNVQKPFSNPVIRIGIIRINDIVETEFALGLEMNTFYN